MVITKEKIGSGEIYIYMNGQLLYKKWPTGSSLLFEKYGANTSNKERDKGTYE